MSWTASADDPRGDRRGHVLTMTNSIGFNNIEKSYVLYSLYTVVLPFFFRIAMLHRSILPIDDNTSMNKFRDSTCFLG